MTLAYIKFTQKLIGTTLEVKYTQYLVVFPDVCFFVPPEGLSSLCCLAPVSNSFSLSTLIRADRVVWLPWTCWGLRVYLTPHSYPTRPWKNVWVVVLTTALLARLQTPPGLGNEHSFPYPQHPIGDLATCRCPVPLWVKCWGWCDWASWWLSTPVPCSISCVWGRDKRFQWKTTDAECREKGKKDLCLGI